MQKYLIIFIIFFFLFQLSQSQEKKHSLKGLTVFIRHGARAPFLEDFYKDQWEGLQRGDLSKTGQLQLENLGAQLRELYINQHRAFPQTFHKDFVKVKFAFINRCLSSLLGFLKGLYPDIYNYKKEVSPQELKNPSKDLGFSFDFNDYAEFQRDLLFRANDKKNCEIMKHIQQKKLKSEKFQQIFRFFRDHPRMKTTVQKLEKYRKEQDPSYNKKIELTSMFQIKEIYDSYLMNKKHGKPIPDWDEQELHLLQMQYEHFFFRFFGFNEARMLEASQFFQNLDQISEKIYEPENKTKLYIFSGTKTNIAIFISTLLNKKQIISLGDKKIAPLSAYIAFEFWEDEHGEKYVKLKYGQEDLFLKQCRKQNVCSMQEFRILVKTKIFKNMQSICDAQPQVSP